MSVPPRRAGEYVKPWERPVSAVPLARDRHRALLPRCHRRPGVTRAATRHRHGRPYSVASVAWRRAGSDVRTSELRAHRDATTAMIYAHLCQ